MSSPFIKPITRMNFAFSKSILFKLICASTTSLSLSSSSSFCAKDNQLKDKNNILLLTKEIIITKERIWI
jgi:hypothetical protein